MKIYFNEAFVETNRDTTNELWVKYNNGNTLEAYFKGLDLRDPSINARIVLRWPSGKTTNEMLLLPSFDRTHFNYTMPILEEDGILEITIRIYKNGVLTQPVIFTRDIKDSIDPIDCNGIPPEDYQTILNEIKKNRDAISNNQVELNKKRDKVLEANQVYTTDELGNQSSIEHSVHPQKGKKTVAVRGETGRLEIEEPENPKDATNKCYVDILLAYNRVGLLAATGFDNDSGEIILIYNPDLVELITDVDEITGEIAVYPRPLRLEEGSNK